VMKLIARLFLNIMGWESEGGTPAPKKYVLIAAPHTSNWDLPYLLAYAAIFDVKIQWMGKHSIFNPPFGWLFKALGGLPIKRHVRLNRVENMANLFQEHEELILVVSAEGTRAYTEHWKSGFYHIAKTAGVPIVLSFLDFKRKRGGFGPAIMPSDDIKSDMDQIRKFYAEMEGKYHEKVGPIRLREELSDEPATIDAVAAIDAAGVIDTVAVADA
jgi:1-acyl-sn-glycerol-3-phosphate acyltransferase